MVSSLLMSKHYNDHNLYRATAFNINFKRRCFHRFIFDLKNVSSCWEAK